MMSPALGGASVDVTSVVAAIIIVVVVVVVLIPAKLREALSAFFFNKALTAAHRQCDAGFMDFQ